MKVSVLQEKLSKGLISVSRVVSSKPTLPVLSNVLLTAKQGQLELFATDLHLGIRISIGAKISKDGAISVPGKVFSELVSSLPASTIKLILNGDVLHITCGSYKGKISGIAAKEFPVLGEVTRKKSFLLDAKKFQTVVEQVALSASSDETRPVLSGVLWMFADKRLQLVATDGYRLSISSVKNSIKKKIDAWRSSVKKVVGDGLVVPARALRDVDRLIDEFGVSEIKVGLASESNMVVFVCGDGEVTSRLIEGTFPNFSKVIPSSQKGTAVISTEPLVQAIRTSAIFARDNANIVNWKLSKGSLMVSSNSPSFGESETTIDIDLSGEEGEIAFNSRYLLDLFSVIKSEKVEFSFSGGLNPGVFRPLGKVKDPFLHLVMPVRVQK